MTARAPLYWNGSQLQEMSASQINTFVDLAVYYYSLDPSRTLTVSGSGGNLTSIDDTRLQAGAYSTASGSYPSEATTAEPSEVTVSYQRITQSAASVSTTTDTGKTFPVYWDGSAVKHMTEADFLDTFIYPAITQMSSGSTTSQQAGTYFISGNAPAYSVYRHYTRFQNITDSTTAIVGTIEFTSAAQQIVTRSWIIGQFTIASSKVFEFQHRASDTKAGDGLGTSEDNQLGGVQTNIYANVTIEKIG